LVGKSITINVPLKGGGTPKLAVIPLAAARKSAKTFDDITPMSTAATKQFLDDLGVPAKNRQWAYSLHKHHLFPKWLGGKADGPTLKMRGYEHISDLEPAWRRHIKEAIPEITRYSKQHVDDLVRTGRVTRDEITDSLVDFYRTRYPNLPEKHIRETLAEGL